MTPLEKIVEAAANLSPGEMCVMSWQRGLTTSHIQEILKEKLPGIEFRVNETINGFTIKI